MHVNITLLTTVGMKMADRNACLFINFKNNDFLKHSLLIWNAKVSNKDKFTKNWVIELMKVAGIFQAFKCPHSVQGFVFIRFVSCIHVLKRWQNMKEHLLLSESKLK